MKGVSSSREPCRRQSIWLRRYWAPVAESVVTFRKSVPDNVKCTLRPLLKLCSLTHVRLNPACSSATRAARTSSCTGMGSVRSMCLDVWTVSRLPERGGQ